MFGRNEVAGDNVWELIVQLNDILSILFSPKHSGQMVVYLHGVVDDFLN